MSDNEFDDIIKKRLLKHEADVPNDMWERIAGSKKLRTSNYMWRRYLPALLLLLLVSGGYIFYTSPDKKTSTKYIDAHANNDTRKPGNNRGTNHANEQEVTKTGINKNNTIAFGVNKNKKPVPESFLYDENAVSQNNNVQPFISNKNRVSKKQQYTDSTIYALTDKDNVKIVAQKKQATINAGDGINNDAGNNQENSDYDKFSLQLFASPDLPFSTINSSDKNYQELLQKAISLKLSYTIGAGISIAVSKKISLSTGVQYSRINEEINFEDSISVTHNPSHNHFTFINVPFTIKYKTALTTSFQTSIHAGILLNISSKYTGTMPDAFGVTTSINHNVYKPYTGVSLYAGINFSKAITKKADVFAEPYFRYQTKNITDHLQPFTRQFYTAGMALGIQYRLYKN